MNFPILDASFFQRSPLAVAPALLGKLLIRQLPDGSTMALPIHEVEAYDGWEDRACHASRGRTKRTEVMFWEGGCLYVYLCYGIHWMLNLVCGDRDYPAAVLIRGAGSVSGPGKLTKLLHIDGTLHGKRAVPESHLWIADRGAIVPESQILQTPRIGVDYAGEWAQKPWRFLLSAPEIRV